MSADETRRQDAPGLRERLPSHLLRLLAALVVGALLVMAFHTVTRDADTPPSEEKERVTPRAFADLVDRIGISRDGSAVTGDLDGAGNSLSAQALAAAGWIAGREITVLGTSLELPDYGPGRPDHLVSDGQHVRLDGDHLQTVAFLAAGTRSDGSGEDARGTGYVVYADGGEQEFTLTVPDWAEGPPADAVLNLPYANSTTGFGRSTVGSVRLYARTVPVDPIREVSHLVMPRGGADDGDIHVFAVEGVPIGDEWVGTWARATSGFLEVGPWEDQTLRLSVRTTTGGGTARIRLDNTFATRSVTIGAASLALRGTGAATHGSAIPLTFGGASETVLPAGGQVFSDPVEILLPPHAEVLISIHLPDRVTTAPVHYAAADTNYTSEPGSGDQTLDPTGEPFTGVVEQWPFLTGVEVLDAPGAVVTIGDSITDGSHATPDAHARWPDVLSDRLTEQRGIPDIGVLNMGVAGNHVVTDVYPGEGVATSPLGVSLRHRVQRDVFAQNGVETLVVFAGINDLRWGTPTQDVVAGLTEVAVLAREQGIRVFVATLGPCAGERLCTPEVEQGRQEVNAYLRGQALEPDSVFDGVWDFDAVLRDPAQPARLLLAYDSGDHLHPGDAGLRAIAESVDLYELVGG